MGTGDCPHPDFLNTHLLVNMSVTPPKESFQASLVPVSSVATGLCVCRWRETGQRCWGRLLSCFPVWLGGPHSLAGRVPGMLTLSNLKRLSRKRPGSCSSPLPGSQ